MTLLDVISMIITVFGNIFSALDSVDIDLTDSITITVLDLLLMYLFYEIVWHFIEKMRSSGGVKEK